MAAEFVTALNASSVQPGGIAVVDVRGTAVAVANVAGTYYAFDDTCTHEQCSLADGHLAGTTITCMATAPSSMLDITQRPRVLCQ